jgi:hypothetical protein
VVGAGATIVVASCNPNGCTAEAPGDLVFALSGSRLGGNNPVIVAKNTVGTNNAWGVAALGPNLASTSLDPPSPFVDMDIQFSQNPAPTQLFRQEINVFARDPGDHIMTLSGLLNDTGTWDANINPCLLPNYLILNYPTPNGLVQWGPPTSSSTFFSGCQGGIDPSLSGPIGFGSVRGAYVADRGLCSARAFASDVVPVIAGDIFQQFVSSAGATGCVDPEQHWFYVSSYLNENPTLSPDLNPKGGFIMNFYLVAHIRVPGVTDQNIRFNYQYDWALQDGLPALAVTENGADVHGGSPLTDASQTQSSFESALNDQVPLGVRRAAEDKLSIDLFPACLPGTYDQGPGCPPGTLHPVPDCTLDPNFTTPDARVLIDDPGSCANALFAMAAALGNAANDGTFASLGINPQESINGGPTALQMLQNVISEPDPANPSVFHNWRCVSNPQSPPEPGHARCEYITRARRLNAYPDSFELVWTDNPQFEILDSLGSMAINNPPTITSGLPLYILALDQQLNPGEGGSLNNGGFITSAYQELCNGAINQSTGSYYAANYGDAYVGKSNGFQCTGTILNDIFSGPALVVSIPASLATAPWLTVGYFTWKGY